MYGGIDQLVDTYKGNPQPLAQKVQRDQQSQPPGRIPPDLEEALALQKITELRNSAQSQQAMQAGGAQPSVVEKLRQMLGGMQQQAQMAQAPQQMAQGEPVMAARGGSIDQLMSNLGRHYAGGGIVAFNGEDESKVEDKKPLEQYTLQQQGADYVARKQAAREAQIRAALEEEARRQALMSQIPTGGQEAPASTGRMPGELERNITNTLSALPGASAVKGFAGGIRGLLAALSGMGDRQEKPTAAMPTDSAPVDMGREGRRTSPVGEGIGTNVSPNLIPASARPQPAPAAPRPSAGGPAAPAVEKLDPESLRGLTEAYLRGEFKLSPEAERDKAADFTKRTLGLDALLAEKERRANEREALIKRAQGERMPDWVEALSAAGRPVRGGLGSLLGQMGNAAQATREAYVNQDLKYQAELAQLRDVITNAKIDGNKELVKQGMAAYKEVNDRRTAAATNATNLVRTDEMTEQRKAEAAARLAASGGPSSKNMANAINAVKNDEVINRLQKDADALGKSFLAKDKAKLADIARQIETRQNAIYKQFGVLEGLSTIAAAPSAASPSGTSLKYNPKTGKIE
jgi:hypothetical protein